MTPADQNGSDPTPPSPSAASADTRIRTPLRPPLPIAMRVNRNVLIIAAVIMAATVVTAIVTMNPNRGHAVDRADVTTTNTTTPHPSAPNFLDHPPHAASSDSVATPFPPMDARSPMDSLRDGGRMMPPLGVATETSPRTDLMPPASTMGAPLMLATPPAPSLRATAYARALASRPSVTLDSTHREQAPTALMLDTLSSTLMSGALLPTADGASSSTTAHPLSSKSGYTTFLTSARHAMPPTIPNPLTPLSSPYTVQAGTVIPGLLITGITSDLPGQILGQVARDVYDSPTQRVVLIPKGAKLIATYDNEIIAGQNRVLVAFTRIIFPDGRSVALPGLGITDVQGAAGVSDDVDNHTRRVFGNALLLSVLSAGMQLSQPRQGTSILTPPSAGQVTAGAVGQELSQVATEILRKNLDVQPTITIRPGTPFNVFLNADLTFHGPYVDARTDPRANSQTR